MAKGNTFIAQVHIVGDIYISMICKKQVPPKKSVVYELWLELLYNSYHRDVSANGEKPAVKGK